MRTRVGMTVLALFVSGCSDADMPEEFRADRDRMTGAFGAFSQATALTQPPSGQTSFTMPPERQDSIYMLIERGVAAADSVDDRFLTWLHPELPRYFRSNLVEGQRLTVRGMRTDNVADQLRGGRLIKEWYDGFWSQHGEAITSKALR